MTSLLKKHKALIKLLSLVLLYASIPDNSFLNSRLNLDEKYSGRGEVVRFSEASYLSEYTVATPIYFLGHLIAVQASIGDRTGYFLFDTGSQHLVLNAQHFTGQSYSPRRSSGSTGELQVTQRLRVKNMRIESFDLPDLRADIVDLGHIERSKNARILGIIGHSVYKNYEVFLDYQFRRMVMTQIDKKGNRLEPLAIPERPIDSLLLSIDRYAMSVQGEVTGHRLKLNLDTGAELNLLDRKVHPEVLENFDILRRVNMVGIGNQEVETLAGRLKNLDCGPNHYRVLRTLLTNLDYIKDSSGKRVDGVLGFPYFFLKRFSFNLKTKKLYFYKTEPLGP